jgi:putative SOS response-associated peptidase YedK
MQVPIVYHSKRDDVQRVMLARWGLIPSWWKNAKAPGHTFNARLEEARDKPMWRQSFRTARCIVPALGWYEWQEREQVDVGTGEVRKYKQPFYMHGSGELIGFAGLMSWAKGEGDKWTASCSILTTAAP